METIYYIVEAKVHGGFVVAMYVTKDVQRAMEHSQKLNDLPWIDWTIIRTVIQQGD